MKRLALVLLLIASPAWAQSGLTPWSVAPGRSQLQFNGPHAGVVPGSCSTGDWYQSTNPTSNFNICGPDNTWNVIGAGTITGSGSIGRIVLWSGASSLTSQAGLTWATSSQTVTIGDAS